MPKGEVVDGLGKHAYISGRIFMPKQVPAGVYEGIPRFNGGQRVFAYGYNLGAGKYNKLTKCMSVELTGASWVSASVIALGAVTAALI